MTLLRSFFFGVWKLWEFGWGISTFSSTLARLNGIRFGASRVSEITLLSAVFVVFSSYNDTESGCATRKGALVDTFWNVVLSLGYAVLEAVTESLEIISQAVGIIWPEQ